MRIKGYNGTVSFDGATVTIERTGFAARVMVGSGSKAIPVQRISAVQFVPAKLGIRGFIEFTIGGGVERRATFGNRTSTAAHDENSVLFGRGAMAEFEALRDAVQAAMSAGPQPVVLTADLTEQLDRLGALYNAGTITAEEFRAAKGQLLLLEHTVA